jgi:hypothetical protein
MVETYSPRTLPGLRNLGVPVDLELTTPQDSDSFSMPDTVAADFGTTQTSRTRSQIGLLGERLGSYIRIRRPIQQSLVLTQAGISGKARVTAFVKPLWRPAPPPLA